MIDLSDQDVKELIALNKIPEEHIRYTFPSIGERLHIPLLSEDKREKFFLDITRGSINLKRATYQTRAKVVYPLIRLDIDGRPHRNPDEKEIGTPHVHIYQNGYGDKWAFEPAEIFGENFKQASTLLAMLEIFMEFCHVIEKPDIEGVLFSSI